MVPLVKSQVARQRTRSAESWWRGPVRWIVAVLALAAAIDAAYLTWTSLSHSVVAGCDGIGLANCDLVLSSPWSKWLFIPVALGGALCYAGIFVLSLLAGRLTDEAGRWAGTLLLMLSLLAAGSGLWFAFLQVFALGAFCPHCMATHLSGLVIAGLVLWLYFTRPRDTGATMQSRSGLAAVPGAGARRPGGPWPSLGPSLGFAAGGAAGVLALLIAGQVLFPPQTYEANKPQLDASIDMTAVDDTSIEADDLSPDAQTHVVNRVTDPDTDVVPAGDDDAAVAPAEEPEDADFVAAKVDEVADSTASATADESETASTTPKDDAPKLAREVKFLNGRMKINMYNEAVIGSPEAPYVIVELMDYTCPHCREMHKNIKRAKDRYGSQLAVVVMPVPLEMECNKMVGQTDPLHRGACRMSRLALGVAKLDPDAFSDFHNWLLADEKNPPSGVQTLNRAWQVVDQKDLSKLVNNEEIKKRITQYINLYTALSKLYSTKEKPFGLPVQIVGDTALTGKFESPEAMFEAWEKALDIKPE
jgi:uncharacterized membrane protein/protein-disulfide isomerase